MEIFKVGGCVRDFVMCVESRDEDFVVVNGSHDEMIAMGFHQVGADFPVYINEDGDEFALARTERKIGTGYNGFETRTENVSLEDDLRRRDLTINAMAMRDGWEVIDLFGGQKDIEDQKLRHIDADAFKEDPVRVLRIARFLARWPNFTVAKETMKLCEEIVASGEMDALTPERVWAEIEKALGEEKPSRFFIFLAQIGALRILMPEIARLHGQTQPFKHHPEGDAFNHTMLVLDMACRHDTTPLMRFCALTHDLGKGVTKKELLPSHFGHEMAGVSIIQEMAARLKIPNEFRDHAMLVARFHTHIHNFLILKASTIVDMFDDLKHKQNAQILEVLPFVSMCDARGRGPMFEFEKYTNKGIATQVFRNLATVKLSNFKSESEIKEMSVEHIKNFLHKEKIHTVTEIRNQMTKEN